MMPRMEYIEGMVIWVRYVTGNMNTKSEVKEVMMITVNVIYIYIHVDIDMRLGDN